MMLVLACYFNLISYHELDQNYLKTKDYYFGGGGGERENSGFKKKKLYPVLIRDY